jgi:hypothetical protein
VRSSEITRALSPTQAFDLACHVIRTLPSPYLPSFGGATLAHLFDHHGATLIDWIEREARRDVAFRTALSNAWLVGEGVHPAILIRLRVAAGARVHIARRAQRDAVYKAIFESWIVASPQDPIRPGMKPPDLLDLALEDDVEPSSPSEPPADWSRTSTDVPPKVVLGKRLSLLLRFQVLFLKFQFSDPPKPRILQHMVRGVALVWFFGFAVTTVAAPFVLPVLLIALGIISASPVTDLALVVLAFVLATVAAALAGLVTGAVGERRRQTPTIPLYVGFLSLTPHLTLLGLIARSERGLIVAPAVVTGLVVLPFFRRFVRRMRVVLTRGKVVLHA